VATDPTNIRFINPSTLATPPGYTQVVEITRGRTIFIAGQIALDQQGKVVGLHEFRAQTQQVFENLKAALTAVGTDFTYVVKLNIYVVDISQLPVLREVRDQYVNTINPPASTLVQLGARVLPRQMPSLVRHYSATFNHQHYCESLPGLPRWALSRERPSPPWEQPVSL